MKSAAVIVLAIALTAPFARAEAPAANAQKAILVTGASTGIGREITELLVANGHFVYAGARKEADLEALDAIENVQANPPRRHQAGRDRGRRRDRRRRRARSEGLVNNAGVAVTGPFADLKEEDFEFVMDVNTYGPFRVTKAFIPLIRRRTVASSRSARSPGSCRPATSACTA